MEERDPSPATMALSSAVVTDVSDASDKCVCCMSRVVAASPLSSFAALLEDLESWYTGEGVRGKSSCSLKKMRQKKTQGWSHYKQSHSPNIAAGQCKTLVSNSQLHNQGSSHESQSFHITSLHNPTLGETAKKCYNEQNAKIPLFVYRSSQMSLEGRIL